jgi:uncharacterized protein YkwD
LRGSVVIVLALVFACAVATPASAASAAPACAGADATPTEATAAQTRSAIACLIDAARAERGGPALLRNAQLRTAAQRFAAALDADKPLKHTGPGGSSPLDRIADAGYVQRSATFVAGETVGRGTGGLASPAARVKRWLADAATRRVLLSTKYRDVGVGVVTRGDVTTYVVEVARRGRR